jgi:hypothetical protein
MPSIEKLTEVWSTAGACSRAALRRALEKADMVVGRKGREVTPFRPDELKKILNH